MHSYQRSVHFGSRTQSQVGTQGVYDPCAKSWLRLYNSNFGNFCVIFVIFSKGLNIPLLNRSIGPLQGKESRLFFTINSSSTSFLSFLQFITNLLVQINPQLGSYCILNNVCRSQTLLHAGLLLIVHKITHVLLVYTYYCFIWFCWGIRVAYRAVRSQSRIIHALVVKNTSLAHFPDIAHTTWVIKISFFIHGKNFRGSFNTVKYRYRERIVNKLLCALKFKTKVGKGISCSAMRQGVVVLFKIIVKHAFRGRIYAIIKLY